MSAKWILLKNGQTACAGGEQNKPLHHDQVEKFWYNQLWGAQNKN
jgi:hypothetical protein